MTHLYCQTSGESHCGLAGASDRLTTDLDQVDCATCLSSKKTLQLINVGVGLRDKFAMAALSSESTFSLSCSDDSENLFMDAIARNCYRMADAMMEARK